MKTVKSSLFVNRLHSELQLLCILAILKKRHCDITDNMRCHRCAPQCQQTNNQLKFLIFELSISLKFNQKAFTDNVVRPTKTAVILFSWPHVMISDIIKGMPTHECQ